MPDPALCQVCLDCLYLHKGLLFVEQDDNGDVRTEFDHHIDWQSLESSGSAGCAICSIAWAQFEEWKIHFADLFEGILPLTRLALRKGAYLSNWSLDCNLQGVTPRKISARNAWPQYGPKSWAGFMLNPYDELIADEIYDESKITWSSLTGSTEVWNMVRGWLGKCEGGHPECSLLDQPAWYPTRLLDVGTTAHDAIRLVLSAESPPEGDYLTLSHRWGGDIPLKLTTATLLKLCSGITKNSLPLTFQHAVEVTRRLQKRYLWIDALCILQDADDRSDWLREATAMGQIYSNGFLNIAAAGGRDSSNGLFVDRDPFLELKPVFVPWKRPATDSQQSHPAQLMALIDVDYVKREVSEGPLGRRGWVFQERLLSARTLHFGSRQVFWECRRSIWCESWPEKLPRGLAHAREKPSDIIKLQSPSTMQRRFEPPRWGRLLYNTMAMSAYWTKVVESYSFTELTFVEDKAIALSGIAKAVNKYINDDYVAGLWRRGLEAQLSWMVSPLQLQFLQRAAMNAVPCHPQSTRAQYDTLTDQQKESQTQRLCMPGGQGTISSQVEESVASRGVAIENGNEVPVTTGSSPGETCHAPPAHSTRFAAYHAPTWSWLSVNAGVIPYSAGFEERWARVAEVTVRNTADDSTGMIEDGTLLLQGRLRRVKIHPAHSGYSYKLPMSIGGVYIADICLDDLFYWTEETACPQEYFAVVTGKAGGPCYHTLVLKCVDRHKGVFNRFGIAFLAFSVLKDSDAVDMLRSWDPGEAELPCTHFDGYHQHTITIK